MPKTCAYGTCNSDSRYPKRLEGGVVFFPFPKPKTQEERCRMWIRQCGRPYLQLNPSKVNRNTFVCSKHFVNGRPTPDYPNPVAALPAPVQKREYQEGCRKPPIKRTRCDVQDAAQACTSNTIEENASEQRETQQCVMDTDNEPLGLVKSFKECIDSIRGTGSLQGGSISSVLSTSGESPASVADTEENEMHPLGTTTTVMVPKRAYERLNRSRISIFTRELAALVFTKEALNDSTLSGKSSEGAPLRRWLDVEKVQAIIDAVVKEFPNTSASAFRTAIRQKCTEQRAKKKMEV